MAGAGWKDFVPGEVLSAANVQDYLQDQSVMVFASAAARTSALASPSEGMVSYLKDTDTVERFDGSSWVVPFSVANGGTGATTVAGAQDSLLVGAVNVIPTSVANAGGSSSVSSLGLVTFTGVTSLSLNGIFSSACRNYRLILNADASAFLQLRYRMRLSGTDNSSGDYNNSIVQITNFPSAAVASYVAANAGFGLIGDIGTLEGHAVIDILNPNIASPTKFAISSGSFDGTAIYRGHAGGGHHNLATAYDGLTLFTSTGNITGTLQVIGYNI